MNRVAVIQSSYIPWKGFFDIIHDVDLFVFYDDVQFTRQDWRSRNRIKTANGPIWLTVPTGVDIDRLICEVEIKDRHWGKKHWKSIAQNYSKAPHFQRYKDFFEHVYLGMTWERLSDLNQFLIAAIARDFLKIQVKFKDSREYAACGRRLDRLVDLVKKTGANLYVSGPSAKDYIEEGRFAAEGIELRYKSYEGYPEYKQLYPPFDHAISIVDVLFNTGPDAPWYIWGWRDERREQA